MDEEHVALFLIMCRRRRRRRCVIIETQANRRFWVRQIFAKREQLGEFHTLEQEMRSGDREIFFN